MKIGKLPSIGDVEQRKEDLEQRNKRLADLAERGKLGKVFDDTTFGLRFADVKKETKKYP